jgi:hypothetical protein
MCAYVPPAAFSYSRWALELATIIEYAGLDITWQHLAIFKLAQVVRTLLVHGRVTASEGRGCSCATGWSTNGGGGLEQGTEKGHRHGT